MASVRVAVRVRPMNQREVDNDSRLIIRMQEKKTQIINHRLADLSSGDNSRDRTKEFTYDFSYWSCDHSRIYTPQEQVFLDLGTEVVNNAFDGYNACVFAYGQTGSGKTYTMMGNPDDRGLIPRTCHELFTRMNDVDMTYRTEVSYMEIYNERVRDLLKSSNSHKNLRVREHPKDGPYVQDLSRHVVTDYSDIYDLMMRGTSVRATAATNMNDTSSRSHAIFTLYFTQAKLEAGLPQEKSSKVHLVDLAGSERADATGLTGERLKEGGNINKSLVTLGNVISVLAELSDTSSTKKRSTFIPYRDSVLTWLLKDSLGGNSKTIMIATISPAECNYAETLSTLRYANRAKNIVNKPTVNEDPNVKLIRELREEIAQLRRAIGGSGGMQKGVKEKLCENEARVKVLTHEWAERWREMSSILEEDKSLALRREGPGIILDSEEPHLIGLDSDVLSTGIVIYQLKEGITKVGSADGLQKPDIVLTGPEVDPEHCQLIHEAGTVRLVPQTDALCRVDGRLVSEPEELSQGAVILLGTSNMFRFNHPKQAREMRKDPSRLSLSTASLFSGSMVDLYRSTDSLSFNETDANHEALMQELETKRQEVVDLERKQQDLEVEREKEVKVMSKQLHSTRTELEQLKNQLGETAGVDLEREKLELKKTIRDEIEKLCVKEEREIEEREESLAEFRATSPAYQQLTEQLQDVKTEEERKTQQLQVIQQKIEAEQEFMRELCSLEKVCSDHTLYNQLSSDLSLDTQDQLRTLSQQMHQAVDELRTQQEQSAASYKHREEMILERKFQTLRDLQVEREECAADRIYLTHCEETLTKASCTGDVSDESMERERRALVEERSRISEREDNLKLIEQNIERVTKEDLENLQKSRDREVKELNILRDNYRRKLREWKDLVGTLVSQRRHQLHQQQAEPSHMQVNPDIVPADLDLIQNDPGRSRLEHSNPDVVQNGLRSKSAGVATGERREKQVSMLQAELGSLERARNEMEAQIAETLRPFRSPKDKEISCIRASKERLLNLNVDEIETLLDLRKMYMQLGQVTNEDDTSVQRMLELEERLEATERLLSSRQEESEQHRREEENRLELGRYELQELEEKERINALVQQELKRKLLDERRKSQRMRRSERMEREKELQRIRRRHQREMDRLKERLQEGPSTNNAPTEANPYASIMSGDSTPHLLTSEQRVRSSRSLTNLARSNVTQSTEVTVLIPDFVFRGSGLDGHVEYHIELSVNNESWSVLRRYNKFREFHYFLKEKFPEIATVVFPPKKWFMRAEKLAHERRPILQAYLSHVVTMLQSSPSYPLHPCHHRTYTKQVLWEFHPFFRRGLFESDQHGTA